MLLSESVSYDKHLIRANRNQGSYLNHCLKDLDEALNITRLPGTRLQQLLIATRHRYASDDRDRVFALLNMVKGEDKSAVPIDYTASVKDIFTKTAYSSIQSSKMLDVLRMAGLQTRQNSCLEPEKRHPELPSWIPNWLDAALLDEFTATKQHRRGFYDEDPIEDEESGQDLACSTTKSILRCQGRILAILFLSPAQNTAALYPVKGTLYTTFATLLVVAVIHATAGTAHMSDYSPKWKATLGRNRVDFRDYVGNRLAWANGDLMASFCGSSDLCLLRRRKSPG